MEIKRIDCDFSICKVSDFSSFDSQNEYFFVAKTDEENSLVCMTDRNTIKNSNALSRK